MKGILILLIVVAILGGGYFWYSSSVETPTPTPQVNTSPTPVVNVPPTMDTNTQTSQVKEFNFTNQGMKFDKTSFTVKKGDRVKVTYTNAGGTHDLRIDDYNVGTKVLSNGKSESFEFVADEAGSFEFYCSVGNHRAMGMKGMFTVTP